MHKIMLEDNAKTSIEHQKRLNPVEGCCKEGSAEMVKCKLYLCNIRQPLGEPSSCGSQEGWIHYDQE